MQRALIFIGIAVTAVAVCLVIRLFVQPFLADRAERARRDQDAQDEAAQEATNYRFIERLPPG